MSSDSAFPLPAPALDSGTPIYVTGEDAIRLTVLNSAAGVTVSLRGRFLPIQQSPDDAPSRVGPFAHDLIPTTNRVASVRTQTLGEGWLLDWSVQVTAGTPLNGQCYAFVSLARGTSGSTFDTTTLGRGYVTANQRLYGPGSAPEDLLDGAGALRAITGTVPGAGAEILETVPAGARWELIALAFVLANGVGVANRVVRIVIDDGANVYFRTSSGTNQVASITVFYSAAQGAPFFAFATDSTDMLPLPDNLRMAAGHRWRTLTAAIQAADQYSAVQYLVREWIEG